MTPTHKHSHVSRALVAALIGVIAVPTAMTGLFQSIDDDGVNAVPVQDLRYKALHDAGRVRAVRRDYWRAVGIYNELVRLGVEGLAAPDVNDVDSIEYYLTPSNFEGNEAEEVLHGSAPEEATVSEARAQYNVLLERYQDLIDGYINVGYCPGTLKQYHLAGFYELCTQLLDEHLAKQQVNLVDRSAYLRGFQPVGYAPLRNLRNRLENLQQSLQYEGGTSVRPKTYDGTRRPRLPAR